MSPRESVRFGTRSFVPVCRCTRRKTTPGQSLSFRTLSPLSRWPRTSGGHQPSQWQRRRGSPAWHTWGSCVFASPHTKMSVGVVRASVQLQDECETRSHKTNRKRGFRWLHVLHSRHLRCESVGTAKRNGCCLQTDDKPGGTYTLKKPTKPSNATTCLLPQPGDAPGDLDIIVNFATLTTPSWPDTPMATAIQAVAGSPY